ncbi:MAG: penicillin-binding protein 2 [Rickettsiales bacterium]|jgi:penicillin-binding protein 2|nr:penicillin-binding protein 2 [Rickettsiales bacterium]
MRNISYKQKVFTRRLFIVSVSKFVLTSVIILRLIQLQIINFAKFRTRSDSNRIKSFVAPPLRGEIVDSENNILATNTTYYRILLNQDRSTNVKEIISKVAKLLKIPTSKVFYNSAKAKRKSSDGYVLIHEDLTWEEVSRIEVNIKSLPGIYIEKAQRRFYPYNHYLSAVVGYVASVNEQELRKSNNALLSHPDFKIGKSGIEKSFENYLRGKAGLKHLEVDAYGYKVRDLQLNSSKTEVPGGNLKLTLNIELQKYTMNLLKDKQASVTVIDIETGDIVAMVSTPSFNANDFVVGISNEKWDSLVTNSGKPLQNKAITNQYPPGSIFKIMVALAALENGYNPKQTFHCSGKVKLGRRYYHCWKEKGHGTLDLEGAIKHSCNIYFYLLSREIGIDNIADMAFQYGLGSKVDLPLSEQNAGFIPNKEWKRKALKEPWVVGDTFNSAIGQGYVQTTNIQLATLSAKIASNLDVKPRLIIDDGKKVEFKPMNIKYENLSLIHRGMYKVVNEPKGTAYYSRIRNKKYAMSGKTGTSQVVSLEHTQDKEFKEIDFNKRNHALFMGYAPSLKPKFAISVIVEHGGSGSGAAAPLGRLILYKAQKIWEKKKL